MTLQLSRRRFLTIGAGVLAAPAIVRASSLMPIRMIEDDCWSWPVEYGCAVPLPSGVIRSQIVKELLPGLNALFKLEYEAYGTDFGLTVR